MQVTEPQNSGSSIYPFLILAALSLLAVFDNRSPLDSLRPDQSKLSDSKQTTANDTIFELNQRIWEDPFKNTWFHEGKATRSISAESPPAKESSSSLPTFADLPDSAERVLIMPVIFPDRPQVRDQEERSRRRYAIHQALSVAGYRSMNASHVVAMQLDEGGRVAVERFEMDGLSQRWYQPTPVRIKGDFAATPPSYLNLDDFSSPYDVIVIVYVRSGDIDSDPINQLKAIKEDLINRGRKVSNSQAQIDLRIIGPASSGQVFKIVSYLAEKTQEDEEYQKLDKTSNMAVQNAFITLVQKRAFDPIEENSAKQEAQAHGTYMFSPVATADYETLAGQESNVVEPEQAGDDPEETPGPYAPTFNKDPGSELRQTYEARTKLNEYTDIRFVRTVHNDSTVFQEVLKELKTRNLLKRESDLQTIALITESDTRYGRSMTANFLKAAQNLFPAKEEDNDSPNKRSLEELQSDKFRAQMNSMRVFPYISGIDGDLSVREEQGSSSKSSGGSINEDPYLPAQKSWKDPIAHGNHQIDYIRRLAQDIIRQTREGETPVRVIGILGTDVYDKLLLMRALKPVVGEVQFFTTDLDARLWHSSEIEFTRNMIVGSSHGLKLNEKLQRFVPPFRDSYQASIFASVLVASNTIRYPYEIDHYTPQVFEIGRTAPVYLRGGEYKAPNEEAKKEAADHTPLFPKQIAAEKSWVILWWVVTLIAMTLAISISKWYSSKFQGPHSKDLTPIAYTKLFLSNGVFAAIITLGIFCIPGEELEPLSLYNGTSAWPGFFLNLFNATLAVSLGTYIGITRIDAANRALEKHTLLTVENPRDFNTSESWWKKNPEFINYFKLFAATAIYGLVFDLFANNEDRFGDPIAFVLTLLILPVGIFLFQRMRADIEQLLKNAKERTKLSLDNDAAMLIRGFYFPLFLMMILTAAWALASNYNFLPLRSPIFHGLFGLSQLLQFTTMMTLLSYVVYESIWVTALVWGLSKRKPHGIIWDSQNILKLSEDEKRIKKTHDEAVEKGKNYDGDADSLLQIGARCVDFTSRITEVPNRYLVYPFIVLMVWFLGQNTDFEGWAWTQLRWFLAFCLFGFCLLPTAILRISAMKLRSRVVRQLKEVESTELFSKPVKSDQHSPGDFVNRLHAIRRGAYAPMLNQPAVLAILTPMGGLGSIAIIKLFFSYVV